MSVRLTSVSETSVSDTSVRETSSQEMSAQPIVETAELPQATSSQDRASQLMLAFAASSQLSALKTGIEPPAGSGPTNRSSALFGFGGLLRLAALAASSSPTPSEPFAAFGVGRAPSISAPFTWSGVKLGCRARICAAAPATAGA